MLIDAKDAIVGRIAAFAAKKALLGENVNIINCEEAVITGDRKWVLAHYVHKMNRGSVASGPFFKRLPDRFFRRAVRGMLQHRQERGATAYKKIKCYIGAPEKFKEQKAEIVPKSGVEKLPNTKFIKVKELCLMLGGA